MALKRKLKLRILLGLVLLVSTALVLLAWPREDIALKKLGIDTPLKIKRGLDLQGGVYLVYEADMSKIEGNDLSKQEILNNTVAVVQRRVDPSGTKEAIIQAAANNRIVVQIPDVGDPAEAENLIGKTAELQFFEVLVSEELQQQLVPTDISGKDIRRATVNPDPNTRQVTINLEFKGGESTEKFADLTTKLSQSGDQLITLLDGQVVFGPARVSEPITGGTSQLSGGFDIKQAKEIATLLNAGALPVPIKLVAKQTIGPTLGELSIKQSLVASIVGLLCVILFLIFNYRLSGVLAGVSIIVYTAFMVAIIKLSAFTSFTIVLTLAGIAGFILSIAVAADANILIIERMKEELRMGASLVASVEAGFDRAWNSIRDSNSTTLISSAILYMFGAPIIKGFAVVLGVGVAVSLITVMVFTRLMLRVLARSKFNSPKRWLGIEERAA